MGLPLTGQHLIVGGPGTGKSVVALLRARRLTKSGAKYRFLVYNHLLDQSNRHLFGREQSLTANTWETWFRQIWFEIFRERIPTHDPKPNTDYREIDWARVERQIAVQPKGSPVHSDCPALVIDEGQDLPAAFYRALTNLGFEDFYVVADQNQQIHPERCSSRQDLQDCLGLDPGETIELRVNYRNSHRIAALARHFFTGDPASPPPELPPQGTSDLAPRLVVYGSATRWTFDGIAGFILQLSDRQPRKLIGIITPNNNVREKFLAALHVSNPRLENDRPPIQTYASSNQAAVDFGTGGIVVINAHSCKGLEFDIALLADIDAHQPKRDPHALRSRFYVMVARAREQVILLRTGEVCPVVEGLLPADPALLTRS